MNLNKVFPRLTIRAKLLIALIGVAVVPLVGVSMWGVRTTVAYIEANARATVDHDLHLAESQVTRSIRTAQSHVQFLTDAMFGPMLRGAFELEGPEVVRAVAGMIATEPTLFQVKVISGEGDILLALRATGMVPARDLAREDGTFYAWRASSLLAGDAALLPIEIAAPPDSAGERAPLPAVAILFPVRDAQGTLVGVVVGESYASRLFQELELASPGFGGVTGLVDRQGRFLYHSVRKRHWSSLLAQTGRLSVRSDFAPEVSAAILSGVRGSRIIRGYGIVSYRPLDLGGALGSSLILYRGTPLAPLAIPVRRFVALVLTGGAILILLVVLVAFVAADQFTKPIYRLRAAAHRLASGEDVAAPQVETNDELEELAEDFGVMAESLSRSRRAREAVIEERTRALEATHAELADLLKHSADAIVGVDQRDVVRVWNDGAERLFGHPAATAIGRPLTTLIGPSGPAGAKEVAYLRALLARDGAVLDYRTTRHDATQAPLPVSLTATLLRNAEGEVLGASYILRDFRLREQLEDQMRRSERLAAVHVMAAGLAHEINNPLAILHNRIELMQRDARDRGAPPTVEEDLAVLEAHVTRLGDLTTGLLRFARDDAGAGPVHLEEVARRLFALLERTFAGRQLALGFSCEPELPPVHGNEKAIETVMVNLLLNAADATPPGGRVHLALQPAAGEALRLIVTDTGRGVPLAERERIFEPFFTTKDPGRGTGLGLTVCRSIVERHGGTILADSAPEGGGRFVVTLPRAPVDFALPHPAEWTAPAFS